MKAIKIVLAAAALVFAANASAQDLTSVQGAFTEGAEALKAKNFNAAIPLFEQVISEGMDVEGAEGLVTEAKKALPTAIFQSGGQQFQGGNLDGALAAFSKAAELAELYGNAAVLNNARTWIGRTVLRQGADAFNAKDYATAAAIFQKGYDGNPNDTAVAMNLAMSYIGMDDYARGNEIYRRLIAMGDLDTRFAEAAAQAQAKFSEDNLARASLAAQAQDFAGAVAAADEILEVISTDAAANLFRLQALNNQKSYARVIEVGEAAVAAQTADEARSNAAYLVGAAYQNRENWAKAIEYYRMVTAGPNVASARAQVAELQKVAN